MSFINPCSYIMSLKRLSTIWFSRLSALRSISCCWRTNTSASLDMVASVSMNPVAECALLESRFTSRPSASLVDLPAPIHAYDLEILAKMTFRFRKVLYFLKGILCPRLVHTYKLGHGEAPEQLFVMKPKNVETRQRMQKKQAEAIINLRENWKYLFLASSVWWTGVDGAKGNELNRKGFLTTMSQLHANLLKLLLTKKHLKISALKARKLRESLKKLHEDAAGRGQESQSYFGVPLHLQQQVRIFVVYFWE